MTRDAIKTCVMLSMAIYAESHVDLFDRNHTIHVLHIAVAVLACDSSIDMRPMGKLHKIRQNIDPVPADFKRRLRVVSPRPGNRLDTT